MFALDKKLRSQECITFPRGLDEWQGFCDGSQRWWRNTYSSISVCGSVKVSLVKSRYEVATTSECVEANEMCIY